MNKQQILIRSIHLRNKRYDDILNIETEIDRLQRWLTSLELYHVFRYNKVNKIKREL